MRELNFPNFNFFLIFPLRFCQIINIYWLRLITLTSTLIIPDITKTESNNYFIIHCFEAISQFLAGSMKRIEKPFLLHCLRT